jgi:hypothetical protein
MDIYHFEIIAGSMTRNGNQPKCQLAGSFRPNFGLDCSQLMVLLGFRLAGLELVLSWS